MSNSATEEWEDIPGFEGKYAASTFGRIKRYAGYYSTTFKGKALIRFNKEKVISGNSLSVKGYKRVNLTDGKTHFVHRLVATTFITNPSNKPQVNHIDGNKLNNHVSNLEWVTNQENRNHAVKHSLIACGEVTNSAKLSEAHVRQIRRMYLEGYKQEDIAKTFTISQQNVSSIINGKSWKHAH